MLETIGFPIYRESVAEYGSPDAVLERCRALGCNGVEAVWGGDDTVDTLPDGFALGYHLLFYPDWLDLWRGDQPALLRKFGSREAVASFYGGSDQTALLAQYRKDLSRAKRLGAEYVVFHVSNVSIEEGYTYQWEHSHREVIDGALQLINLLFAEETYSFTLLVENQWWPGFTFTDPEQTEYLLNGIQCPNKGIMLDTGHLLNTETALATEAEGAAYLHAVLDRHGALCKWIRGVHLHQSLSGAYVKAHTGTLPAWQGKDYLARFGESYSHILKIDRHQPWTDCAVSGVIARIAPDFLTHELSAGSRAARERAVSIQRRTLYANP